MVIPITQNTPILPPQKVDPIRNTLSHQHATKNALKQQGRIQAELLKVLFSAIQDTATKYRLYNHSIDHHDIQQLLSETLGEGDEVSQLAKLILLHQTLQDQIEQAERSDQDAHEQLTDEALQEKQAALLKIEEKIERLTISFGQKEKFFFKEEAAQEQETNQATECVSKQHEGGEKEKTHNGKNENEKLLSALLQYIQEKEGEEKHTQLHGEKITEESTTPQDAFNMYLHKEQDEKNFTDFARFEKETNFDELQTKQTQQKHAIHEQNIQPRHLPIPTPIIASLFIPPGKNQDREEDDEMHKQGNKKSKKAKKQKKRRFKKILKRAIFG